VLVHTKGRWARRPFLLAPWQLEEIIRPLFGSARWEEQLGEYVRQYTLAWIELARKNGKSELVAGAGLLLLCADDEEEAEIYGAAKDRDQAGVIYQVAKRMVELSPVLSKRLVIVESRRRIIDPKTGSFYAVVAADGSGNLGSNPYGVLFDEIITQPSRELWDALKTGMGTRAEPLMLAATTAGNDPSAMAAEEHLHSERVLREPELDPARFVFMRNTPADADWTDESAWAWANPGLGDFLRIDVLRAEALEAASSPGKQNAFRQYRLNQWVRQVTRWLDLGLWDENSGLVVAEDLRGKECWAGLDMASTSDFAAWVLFFPDALDEGDGKRADVVLPRFWLPEKAVRDRKDAMRPVFELWAREGWLSMTEGETIDYGAIRDQIDRDLQMFRVLGLGYDRWEVNELVSWLKARKGSKWAQAVQQTTSALNAGSKELERLLGSRRLRHGGHPVLRWMADNVTVRRDSAGNIKPDKERSKEKVDGIVALVDALSVWLAKPAPGWVYVGAGEASS
jgi:phage terminase large subunit-like protein